MYHQDIFYNAYHRPLEEKIKICEYAKKHCKEWRVDKLDCNESFSRKMIEMSWEDIISKLTNEAHFVVIHRRGHENNEHDDINDSIWMGRWCLEIGFRTMDIGIDYFLWIYCDKKFVEKIVKKFKLKTLK